METQSISKIRDLNEALKSKILSTKKELINNGFDTTTNNFGVEQEYSTNSIFAGLNNIIHDISYLVNSHQIFIKLSTYTERNSIISNLQNIINYLNNKDFHNLVSSLELIKITLRSFNIRLDKDRFLEFNNAIDETCRQAQNLEKEVIKIKSKINTATTQLEKITELNQSIQVENDSIISQKKELLNQVESLKVEIQSLKNIITSANASNQTINTALTTAKSNEGIINQFAESVSKRQTQLEEQQTLTNDYTLKLESFSNEREELLRTAKNLIEEAKKALNYKSAEGLSAAFSHKLQESDKTIVKASWLIGASIFLLMAFALGAWIVLGWKIPSGNNEIYALIGRITMIPIAFTASMFCANQYLKQKQIIEDYAYKTVLSKSIISFSEALKNGSGQEYTEYISTVLREIHKDPMRKRGRDEIDSKQSLNIIEQFLTLIKTIKGS